MDHLWEIFYSATMKKHNIPRGSTQYRETRRAFYAGAFSIITELHAVAVTHGVPAGSEALLGWEKQCHAFYQEVAGGTA